jgi:ATP-dependent Clp protease adaptor protein ClpS
MAKEDLLCAPQKTASVAVFNDEVNSFAHVVNVFKSVLGYGQEQAEQCALLIHYANGGYRVARDRPIKVAKAILKAIKAEGLTAELTDLNPSE